MCLVQFVMMDESNEIILQKSKRLTSVVWNYFERVRKADVCYAVCIQCNKKLSGSSNSGTTHLRNHLMRCLKRTNHDMSQLLTPKRRKKENPVTVATIGFDESQQPKDGYIRPTNWNSTYEMLETVLEYKGAFCHLRDHDQGFDSSLTDEEWEWTRSVAGYLKLVFEIAADFSGNKCPTANELLDAYSICSAIGDDSSFSGGGSGLGRGGMDARDRLKGFDKFLHETSQNQNTTW
ncbi:hypothetical protein HID58_003323 [Brassica napus]|uniref:BED-type domain-containing protein n=1 Tax=Brassica napus TaxID=3708 RepID=A0ABQ8ESW0_BRANA|nr:hypothetical protein HID58_003323 [Brassica napus]